MKKKLEDHSGERIHAYPEVMQSVTALLSANLSLAALYIDCSKITDIEKYYGRKVYSDVQKKVHEVFLDLHGSSIRKSDIIVSNPTGNDEYVVFLSQKRDDKNFFPTDLETLCDRLTDTLNDRIFPLTFPYLRGRPKIVVGYAIVIHNPLMREEKLVSKLMDDAKVMAEYQKFKRLMRNKEKLQELIVKEGISTIFQPIVDFSKNEIIGYEALSRGPKDSEYENPFVMFDAAAETELVFELDRLCRRKALQNSRGIPPDRRLFINCIPNAVLDPHFRDAYLQSLLTELKLKPVNIVLEVTEREAIENYDLFRDAVQYYTDLGFAIAVDDTGAGYSSLETVLELKPQFIKLDISIVRGVQNNILKQELIKAINALAKEMGSTVIAEGIETEQELDTLRRIGVAFGQGFLFARPGPPFPDIALPSS